MNSKLKQWRKHISWKFTPIKNENLTRIKLNCIYIPRNIYFSCFLNKIWIKTQVNQTIVAVTVVLYLAML